MTDRRELLRTVLFIDLASYTPLTEAMGDHAALDVVARFAAMARDLASQHGGHVVKQIGDEFMLAFADSGDAANFALSARDTAHAEPNFPGVRIGAHRGIVLHHENDYYGATVNLAARIASVANRWQILITSEVRDELLTHGRQVEVNSIGSRSLKGIAGDVELFELDPGAHGDRPLDPVCGMALDPLTSTVTIEWGGRDLRFCSERCRELFLEDPARYM